MKPLLPILTIIAGIALQACGNVVVPTLAALNSVSPLESDPARFEIAIEMPGGADIAPDGATFNLAMARSDTGGKVDETYVLQRRSATDGQLLYRVNPVDLAAVRAFQSKAQAWEKEDPDISSGSITVAVVACRVGEGPAENATFSASIRTETDGLFLPLIRNAPIEDVIAMIERFEGTPLSDKCE